MEIRRSRGVATFITFPFKNASGTMITGVTGISPQYATWTDGTAPNTKFSTISGGVVEINASGRYYSSLTAAEMANDYIYFYASPTTGTARPIDLLINCTKIASVQAVSDTVTATVSSGTVTGVVNSVGVREGTSGNVLSLSNGRIGINWANIANATTTQALTLTTLATVSAVEFVASVSTAVLNNVGTVTGVTNSVTANVGTISGVTNSVTVTTITGVVNSVSLAAGTGANQLNISAGRVGINWADVANPTSVVGLTNTTLATVTAVGFVASTSVAVLSNVGTVTGVTNSVNANVGTITGVVNSVTANVATVTGVVNSVTANVATVTGVTNSVNANVGTISGVLNRVDATLTQGMQGMIADRVLFRSLAGGADGGRTVQDAFRLLRNRRGLTFGAMQTATLTAYLEDDATPAWTAIVGTATAVGLTDVDAS